MVEHIPEVCILYTKKNDISEVAGALPTPNSGKKIRLEENHTDENGSSDTAVICNGDEERLLKLRNKENRGKPLSQRDMKVVSLIIQFLNDIGLRSSSACLSQESQVGRCDNAVKKFRKCIIGGRWSKAERLLYILGLNEVSTQTVLNMIREQVFLEAIKNNKLIEALIILRYKMSQSSIGRNRFEYLSSLLISMDKHEGFIKKPKRIITSQKDSRLMLLDNIKEFIPAMLSIPPNRLNVLLDQAVKYQLHNCLYHYDKNTSPHAGFYSDHVCQMDGILVKKKHVLKHHNDEVWCVKFSHNGEYLASSSKDLSIVIWHVEHSKIISCLVGHTAPALFLAWNNDDTKILTASADHTAKLWSVKMGVCLSTYSMHRDTVNSCAWVHPDKEFVTCGLDKNIFLCNIDGFIVHTWSDVRALDITVSHDGKTLIVASSRNIRLYSLVDMSMIGIISETDFITSVLASSISNCIIVDTIPDGTNIWDFDSKSMICKYSGAHKKRFVIRSCFGGQNEKYVLSGGEDSNIYIWNRSDSRLIEVLSGHSGPVNSVSWSPKLPCFASASDDRTIIIWSTESEMEVCDI